jgi:hypothetical protein
VAGLTRQSEDDWAHRNPLPFRTSRACRRWWMGFSCQGTGVSPRPRFSLLPIRNSMIQLIHASAVKAAYDHTHACLGSSIISSLSSREGTSWSMMSVGQQGFAGLAGPATIIVEPLVKICSERNAVLRRVDLAPTNRTHVDSLLIIDPLPRTPRRL